MRLKSLNNLLKVGLNVLNGLKKSTDKSDQYHDIVQQACALLEKQKKCIEKRIDTKKGREMREIEIAVDKMLGMKWIENFKRHFFKYLIQDLCDKIRHEEINAKSYVSELDIDNYNPVLIETDPIENFRKALLKKLQDFNDEIKMETERQQNFVLDVKFLTRIDCFLKKFPFKILDIKTNDVEANFKKFLENKIDLNKIELDFNSVVKAKDENKEEMIKVARLLNNFFVALENIKQNYN